MTDIRHDLDPELIFGKLAGLEATYPGFKAWYFSKVVPGLWNGSRRIAAAVDDGQIGGIVILKRTPDEKKLCTLWTDVEHGRHSASGLVDHGLAWLGTTRPLFSVPDDLMPRFRPVLCRLDVARPELVRGAYRPGVDENVFNGSLLGDRV